MLIGFDNGFIIKEIFGDGEIFAGAEIVNMNYHPLGGRMSIDIITKCKVIKPPKKWTKWECVCLNIELFAVTEFQAKVSHVIFTIDLLTIKKEGNSYTIEILEKDKHRVLCTFGLARIQRITPMAYDKNLGRYESV